jgi:hypothetical protein
VPVAAFAARRRPLSPNARSTYRDAAQYLNADGRLLLGFSSQGSDAALSELLSDHRPWCRSTVLGLSRTAMTSFA